VLLISGCGGGSGGGSAPEAKATEPSAAASAAAPSAKASAKPAGPATVEQLAAAVGCKAEIRMKVQDFRQGACKTTRATYALLSFTTDKGKREWVDYAQMYGGVYLIGERWVIGTDSRQHIEAARRKLGGSVEEGTGAGS
jgi:hypothetical protein